MNEKKILLVGCGKMGGALLTAIIKQQSKATLQNNILVIQPNANLVTSKYGVPAISTFDNDIIQNFQPDFIIFAVKPQIIASILPFYQQLATSACFISIIAGKTISFFTEYLQQAAIIRTMPNLPVLVGEGVTGYFCNSNVTSQQLSFVTQIFSSMGIIHQLSNESYLDALTAISGSGPAYFFYFIECHPWLLEKPESHEYRNFVTSLEDAAIALGINPLIARQTITGSYTLLKQSGKTATQLRQMVTSPGGTTQAALEILMQPGLNTMDGANIHNYILKAANAACLRSKALSE